MGRCSRSCAIRRWRVPMQRSSADLRSEHRIGARELGCHIHLGQRHTDGSEGSQMIAAGSRSRDGPFTGPEDGNVLPPSRPYFLLRCAFDAKMSPMLTFGANSNLQAGNMLRLLAVLWLSFVRGAFFGHPRPVGALNHQSRGFQKAQSSRQPRAFLNFGPFAGM